MFGRKGVKRVEAIEVEEPQASEDEGYSLEQLGSAYASVLDAASAPNANRHTVAELSTSDAEPEFALEKMLEAPEAIETDGVPVTPETILEAMLFLGTTNNRPIAVDKLLNIFRGVTATELDAAVDALNRVYLEHGRVMEIVQEKGGYRMQLAPEFHIVRDRFYGKVRETQLTQSAIDCLALVAYQPGISKEELEKQWNQPAGSMLGMLIRKGLLRVDKNESGQSIYHTTERFLEVIGLDSLQDLPHSEDL